ncbi:phosphate--nucleotide phosphotransferase [Kibdelosporangium phytohabitans]|uniref:Phosphate--nucleotide phosphotransferase n=2 Tax=Kibdelosporangium phytohabitans TaxID=860235 RepID=A0A0N9I1I5_9PSEU|nr:phosphate--nucleotide phosphotransferase [Kibdelosporangium phytohabitans]
MGRVRDALRFRDGKKNAVKPGDFPVGPTSKSNAAKQLQATADRLDQLQEALYASASQSVLLVLQGMDTSGKGGTIRHACGLVNPQGLHIKSFKKPTRTELKHDFLWRVRRALPTPGMIGVFDRSHYEDVLIAKVDSLVEPDEVEKRYDLINAFEQELADSGVVLIKCFLNISREEQRKRLIARLERPEKHWKYNPADLDARSKWDDYQDAYADALTRCDTDTAPWFVVPSDHKWYRNWAVSQLLLETLESMDPQYPEPSFDVEEELKRVKAAN